MAISDKDIKLLWGRAAGHCSKPGCAIDLTREVEGVNDYVIGEMAHVIARSPEGPRGRSEGGDDSYSNLILLCPTHHREIDKAPDGRFSADTLREWKREHEERVRSVGLTERFKSFDELSATVRMLLEENRVIWDRLGPNSEIARRNPDSNAYRLWELRRADRIVPNNRRIINLIRGNSHLLKGAQLRAFAEFVNHADAYEENVYEQLDEYPQFPREFQQIFDERQ